MSVFMETYLGNYTNMVYSKNFVKNIVYTKIGIKKGVRVYLYISVYVWVCLCIHPTDSSKRNVFYPNLLCVK